MTSWEGKCCNGMKYYALKGKMTAKFKAGNKTASADRAPHL
jgi:hypothetical protein